MYAIVSLLEPSTYSRIEAMWRILELQCGLQGIKTTPFPHFSWHVAENYDFDRVEGTLRQIAATSKPFTVKTAGLGLFTGTEPVIYVLIVKNENLYRFHNTIWEKIHPNAVGSNEHYAPEAWVPHITLAHSDVNRNTLICALEELAFLPFNWEIKIDNLAIVGQTGEEVGTLRDRIEFNQKE
ncbi:MAG: 2'-5' RNA ligase family protein [Chloroflexi bacterium]|nr:2'-5' RNA ligase family protein [Chloroflexota bacterium]